MKEIKKDYYQCEDIQIIIDCKKSYAYELISKLRKSFIKEYPNAIVMQGRIPIWYFEEKMMNKKSEGDG